jgi:hypothetical protein
VKSQRASIVCRSAIVIGAAGMTILIMQDRNHLQVANLILEWIGERVSRRGVGKK